MPEPKLTRGERGRIRETKIQERDPNMTSIHSPRIKANREDDGTWTVTLWVQGVWHAQLHGFASAAAARSAIRQRYL